MHGATCMLTSHLSLVHPRVMLLLLLLDIEQVPKDALGSLTTEQGP